MKYRLLPLLFPLVCALPSAVWAALSADFPGPGPSEGRTVWLALDAAKGPGSTIVELADGHRVFLPFQADCVLAVEAGEVASAHVYRDYRWREVSAGKFAAGAGDTGGWRVRLPRRGGFDRVRAVHWFTVGPEGAVAPDKARARHGASATYLPFYLAEDGEGGWHRMGRYGAPDERPRIYQLLPRLFGNENETRKVNGTLAENGSGTFADLDAEVLAGLREDGFTHLWLTGVLQHATSTDHGDVGQPPDDPDLLKGIAGSPYAIRDYFDVSPDLAEDPANRLAAFRALVERMDAAGLEAVLDFVPNHVARSYHSDIRPELDFGSDDRTGVFFAPDNNFFYLTPEVAEGGPPLRLPTVDPDTGKVVGETARLAGNADGYFGPERTVGRVTGNNVVSWRPSKGDWYETVKLNYGYDFLHPEKPPAYPSAVSPDRRVPDTWRKMDAVLKYWQEMGVDGFRVDMAHMVPPEFWKWVIHRARQRDPEVYFFAEAYDNDPAKVASRDPALREDDNVMVALLDAGFHAVYDDPGYDTLHALYDGEAWASDLGDVERGLGPFFFDCALRYAENHDEVRLAHPRSWGGVGMGVGRPVAGTLFGLSRGPVMVYHGQMVGEPALGREGFGGDDMRTTIFDYWSMPVFNRWWNDGAADGGGLSPARRALRDWYADLVRLQDDPAFAEGETVLLNRANEANPFYGKIEDKGPAGHWFFAYLRSAPGHDAHFLVTANFHPDADMRHLRLRLPERAVRLLDLEARRDAWLVLEPRLDGTGQDAVALPVDTVLREGVYLASMPALAAQYWRVRVAANRPEGVARGPEFPTGDAYLGSLPLTRVSAGETRTLDLRRFGNPGTTHRFAVASVGGVAASIDRLNQQLRLTVADDASGLALLPLRLEPREGKGEPMATRLPLAIESVPAHTFRLEGRADASEVSVVGDFNQWNASAHPMTREGGAWTTTLRLRPGRYLYKFVVDGQWMADPGDAPTEPDGYGGRNSVATVGDGAAADPPTVYMTTADESAVVFRSDRPLARAEASVLEGAGPEALPVELDGERVRVDVSGAAPGSLVRLLAVGEGGAVGLPALAYAGEPAADSWRDDIIYYAFTDRFHDGNPANSEKVRHPKVRPPANYQGGDFSGIRKKLEDGYFEELGVNVLWLAPLNENPDDAWQEYLPPYRYYTGYHGYWPVERFGVESRFGGESALRALVDAAHGAEMKVLADLVLKHVHKTNPIRAERPELFGQLQLSDGTRNLRRWNENPFTTWFEPFLPAFDFRNPGAQAFLLEDAVYWIDEYGLDGYRLDAVKHIRPDFWWRFRTRMRDRFPDGNHYFVGETFESREGISAFVGPNMLDGQFDFPLYDTLVPCFARGKAGFDALERALRQSEEVYGRSVRMSPLLGNHDKPRFMAYADGDLPDPEQPDAEEVGWEKAITVDDPAAYGKLKRAMTFLMTIDGVPMLYYGDEIGMTGAGDPDNRRMMRFGDDVSAEEASVKAHVAKLAHARRAHPSLYLGSRRALVAGANRYAYVRAHGDDRALVLFNRGDSATTFDLRLAPELEDASLRDVIGGERLRVSDGRATVRLGPGQSALYVTATGKDTE